MNAWSITSSAKRYVCLCDTDTVIVLLMNYPMEICELFIAHAIMGRNQTSDRNLRENYMLFSFFCLIIGNVLLLVSTSQEFPQEVGLT